MIPGAVGQVVGLELHGLGHREDLQDVLALARETAEVLDAHQHVRGLAAIGDEHRLDARRTLGLADVKSTLETMGSIGRPTSPEEARAYVLKEYETLGKVIEIANIPSN